MMRARQEIVRDSYHASLKGSYLACNPQSPSIFTDLMISLNGFVMQWLKRSAMNRSDGTRKKKNKSVRWAHGATMAVLGMQASQ